MTPTIVRDPIYQQLNTALRQLIRSGEFREGDKFLTERQVCERFNVSRPTANKAVSTLVGEGILEFRKGVGTFIRGGLLDYDLRTLVSFTDKAKAVGKVPATRVLRFERVSAGAVVPAARDALGVDPSHELFLVDRLRLADGAPVIYEHRYVPVALCPKLAREDVLESIYAAFTVRHGLAVGGSDQTIRAVNLSAAEAKLLEVRRGSAALLVTATGLLEDGRALWWEHTLYQAEIYEFHTHLGGVRPMRPMVGQFTQQSKDTVQHVEEG